MSKRVFLIVLDSFGIGEMPDAGDFGDVGANTVRSVAQSGQLSVPCMRQMGLFNIDGVDCMQGVSSPTASYCRLAEKSRGKDTIVGHWELAGVSSPRALPTYPNGFPADFVRAFERRIGRGTLCNKAYSGTQVLVDYGERHVQTGALIIYTSADSVFQVAAHEDVVPLRELYAMCQTARDMLTDSKQHAVGRVIARPFIGTSAADFRRTANRHDFSLAPPRKTMLDYLMQAGYDTIGVGKIFDIFAGQGVSEQIRTTGNDDGMRVVSELVKRSFSGIAFVNLVDFDMLYGHRKDVDGYAAALSAFDAKLSKLLPQLQPGDLLMITADHGCDPGFEKSTDHTREYVPLLMYGDAVNAARNLSTRASFADVGATICSYFALEAEIEGKIFESIKKVT